MSSIQDAVSQFKEKDGRLPERIDELIESEILNRLRKTNMAADFIGRFRSRSNHQ